MRQADDVADVETGLLVCALDEQFGVDLRHFQLRGLSHKALAFCKQHEIDTISSLQGRLLRDREFAHKAIEFFLRNPSPDLFQTGAWLALRDTLLPMLRSSTWPTIWLAECSSVHLVVQLVALLEEENLLSKTQIFVTHSCEGFVSEMRRWQLSTADLPIAEETHRQCGGQHSMMKFFQPNDGGFHLRTGMQSSIVLGEYEMLTGASMREFEAIICAAPLADFAAQSQRNVVALFAESLCNFGILYLGGAPTLHSAKPDGRFVDLVPAYGIYRRYK